LHFKQLKNYIQFLTKKATTATLPANLETAFVASNRESYYTYQILGDYCLSRKNTAKAKEYYQQALSKEIATLKEKEQIEEGVKECDKK